MRRALALAVVLAGCGAPTAPAPSGASTSPTSSAAPAPAPASPDAAVVVVMELTAQPALLLRVRAPAAELGARMQDAMFTLFAAAATAKVDLAGPPFARLVAAPDDDGTITLDAGVPVIKPVASPGGEVVVGELPAGPAATLLHVGRHDDLATAHAALERWLIAHQRTAAGPGWQVFLTNPITEPDPDAQQTKLFVPLTAEAP